MRYPVVAAQTGNGIGKSFLAAGILWWFALSFVDSRVVVAAPTNAQLSGVVWSEVTRAKACAAKNGIDLGGRHDGLTIELGDGWSIEGFGQGSVEAKSGRHAGHLLALIDEASGIKTSVMEAIDSLNPSHRLYLGNPLRPEGKFFDVCTRSGGSSLTRVIKISSLESPDAHLPRSLRGMADATWLQLCREEYGEDSQWWKSHVLAEFPGELSDTLLPFAWLEEAARIIHIHGGLRRCAVDIAKGEGGDDAMIVIRDDNGIYGAWWSNRWSLEQLAEETANRCVEYGVEGPRVTYDATGIGTDFDNRLRQHGVYGARGYMGSAAGGDQFFNLRSACGWAFRRRLDPAKARFLADPDQGGGIYTRQAPFAIPRHLLARFESELKGLRYQLDDAGRIQIEPKADFVARLKRSPNFVDACMMSFAFPYA